MYKYVLMHDYHSKNSDYVDTQPVRVFDNEESALTYMDTYLEKNYAPDYFKSIHKYKDDGKLTSVEGDIKTDDTKGFFICLWIHKTLYLTENDF